jgi:hypothetical protein
MRFENSTAMTKRYKGFSAITVQLQRLVLSRKPFRRSFLPIQAQWGEYVRVRESRQSAPLVQAGAGTGGGVKAAHRCRCIPLLCISSFTKNAKHFSSDKAKMID